MTTAERRTMLPPAPAVIDADLWTKVRQRYIRYWERESGLWATPTWLGVPVQKLPTDAWVYQELLARVRPDVLIETGTLAGGSALFFATIMDAIGHGQVISIDVHGWPSSRQYDGPSERPQHPRVRYLTGDSTSLWIVSEMNMITVGKTTMVVLDSDHSRAHVLRELDLYAWLVTPGSYLVVEDTGLIDEAGPVSGEPFGAHEALAEWLPQHPEFQPDPACERFLLTTNPGGFLRRMEEA